MITLKDFCEAINYKITGGSEYQWRCFGDNARFLDCEVINENSVVCIFDSENQTVYSIEAWDYKNDKAYRWIHPDYIDAYKADCERMDVIFENACDELNFTDLSVELDILEKAEAISQNKQYDERVLIQVDFSDEVLLQYMKLAHDLDITFNELVERALREAIDELEKDPEAFKQRAERFKNENYSSV